MTIEWDGRPEDVFVEGYTLYVEQITQAIASLIESYRPRIEAWMKQNAPWTDRTGNARQTLHTEVDEMVDGIALHLMHGVTYSVFLEWANQGRFSILMPALDKFAAEIWADLQALFQ